MIDKLIIDDGVVKGLEEDRSIVLFAVYFISALKFFELASIVHIDQIRFLAMLISGFCLYHAFRVFRIKYLENRFQ